jgi:hypothetical protein
MADRKALQNDRINQAENGGVGSDSKRKRQNCHGGESGTGAEGADGVAKVLKKGIEHIAIMTTTKGAG